MDRQPRRTLAEVAADPVLVARFRSPAVELVDGVERRQPPPSAAVVRVAVAVAAAFDDHVFGLRVGVRDAVAAPPVDLLRPEVSLARPGAPSAGRLAPASVALAVLVVERATEAADRLPRYAAAGVEEVWVLDVDAWTGVTYADPQAGRYRRRELLLPGETCAPRSLPWARVVALPRRSVAQASSSSDTSNVSPSTSITSPATTRRFRRVSS